MKRKDKESFNLCVTTMTIFIVHLMLGGMASAGQGVLWQPLKVSHSRLSSGSRQSGSHDLPATSSTWSSNTTCSLSCHQVEWCNVWCPDPSSATSCLFFDMFVVPGYQETNIVDALHCYTRNLKDYAVGATIEGASVNSDFPLRVKENLIDGIYDFGVMDECYLSSDYSDPFFKLDLGSEKPIKHIKMLLQPNTSMTSKFEWDQWMFQLMTLAFINCSGISQVLHLKVKRLCSVVIIQ